MKYVLNRFAATDRTGMERWLEKMALKGWLLKKRNQLFWGFEKIEPQKLRYSLIYNAKVTDDSTFSIQAELELDAFCREAGWHPAAGYLQLQFYWTDDPKAEPLSTDPMVEIRTLERIYSKRHPQQLIHALILCALCFPNFIRFFRLLFSNPSALFGETEFSTLRLPIAALIMLFLTLLPIFSFHRWKKRATEAAALGLELPHLNHLPFFFAIIFIVFFNLDLFLLMTPTGKLMLFLVYAIILLAFSLASGTMYLLKNTGFTVKEKKVIVGIVSLITFYVGLFGAGTFLDSLGQVEHNYQTVTVNGQEQTIIADSLPITVKGLTGITEDRITTIENQNGVYVDETVYTDQPLTDWYEEPDQYYLKYRIYDIANDASYASTLDSILAPIDSIYDPTPWNADQVYSGGYTVLHLHSDSKLYRHIVCYEKRIVMIYCSWELTPEQITLFARAIKK